MAHIYQTTRCHIKILRLKPNSPLYKWADLVHHEDMYTKSPCASINFDLKLCTGITKEFSLYGR
jgi:hypothetical protein